MRLTKGVCSCREQGVAWSKDFKDCCAKYCTACDSNAVCTTCKSDLTLMEDKTCLCVGDWNPRTETCSVCGPSKYYEPEIPGCNYCDEHYYPDPEDPWECLECEGRVSEDKATCEPCGDHEVWDSGSQECVDCYGVKVDDYTCTNCNTYKEDPDNLWYYDVFSEDCEICVGELTADPAECKSCDTNKYFYEPGLQC